MTTDETRVEWLKVIISRLEMHKNDRNWVGVCAAIISLEELLEEMRVRIRPD